MAKGEEMAECKRGEEKVERKTEGSRGERKRPYVEHCTNLKCTCNFLNSDFINFTFTVALHLQDESDAPYWPEDDDPVQTHGTLTVELLKERPSGIPNVTECEISVRVTAEVRK